MDILTGCFLGFFLWFLLRLVLTGVYTVDQNERAVKTSFGRAERLPGKTTLDDPIASHPIATTINATTNAAATSVPALTVVAPL